MELQVFGKNLEVTESMETYVEKKLGKLTRYLSIIDDAKVEIKEEKTKSPDDRFTVQVTVKSKNVILRAEEKGAHINAVIDTVIEILTKQIRRYKGKVQKKGRRGSSVRQPSVIKDNSIDEEASLLPEVVRVKHITVKSMSLSEAIEQMELISHDFFLFASTDTGKLNLVYKRKDGNYGIIQPDLT